LHRQTACTQQNPNWRYWRDLVDVHRGISWRAIASPTTTPTTSPATASATARETTAPKGSQQSLEELLIGQLVSSRRRIRHKSICILVLMNIVLILLDLFQKFVVKVLKRSVNLSAQRRLNLQIGGRKRDAGGSALTQQERGSRRMSIPTVGEPSAAEGTGQQDVARGHEEQPARCGWWPTFVERTRGCRRACDVRLTASPRAAISADTLVFCT